MHIHHYTLTAIADYLGSLAGSWQVVEIFTQEKDELVIGLASESDGIYLRVSCASHIQFIWPVNDFAKRRKNVMDLYGAWLGSNIKGFRCLKLERVMVMETDRGEVFFKMHGNRSNVIFKKSDGLTEIFNQRMKEDVDYVPTDMKFLMEEEDWPNEIASEDVAATLKSITPIWAGPFAKELQKRVGQGSSFSEELKKLVAECTDGTFWLSRDKHNIRLLCFKPIEGDAAQLDSVEKAVDVFIRSRYSLVSYAEKRERLEKAVLQPAKKIRKKISSYQRNLETLANERSAEEIGNIIMANLHALEPGMKEVELPDVYGEGTLKLKLDPKMNPVQNAEKYYQKEKKRKSQAQHLKKMIKELQAEISGIEEQEKLLLELPPASELSFDGTGFDRESIRMLNELDKELSPKLKAEEADKKPKPYIEFEKGGYSILVGKNAKSNDELTFKHCTKEDIWMHARNVAGSHVVIRLQAGKQIPKDVLEYAASLAARYSKSKHESLVPVIYVPRKFVRKRKGAPAGEVMVEREEVLFIEPAAI